MQATFEARRSPFSFLIALALLGTLCLGGAGGYLLGSMQARSSATLAAPLVRSASGTLAVDPLTGYPSGSVDDQRILAMLKHAAYEGGATVVQAGVDPLTGYRTGSADDQRILATLKQAGYEGGASVVHGGSGGGERP
jgi:hypothetical protein